MSFLRVRERIHSFFSACLLALLLSIVGAWGCGGSVDKSAGEVKATTATASAVALELSQSKISSALGLKSQLAITALLGNGSRVDVSSQAVWQSSDASIVVLTLDASGFTFATGLKQGTVILTATYQGKQNTIELTITAAELNSISITPLTPSLVLGGSQQLRATAKFTDGNTEDFTGKVVWNSETPSAVSVSATAPNIGTASALAVGASTITASNGKISGSTVVTVARTPLISIAVGPSTASITAGTKKQFTAMGTYVDGTIQDITEMVTWNSSSTAVATFSNISSSFGLASSLAQGTTTISATSSTIVGNSIFTVTALPSQPAATPPVASPPVVTPPVTPPPPAVVTSPVPKFAYVTNAAANTISQYSIDDSGALTFGSTFTLEGGSAPSSVAINASTKTTYVSNLNSGTVSQFTIASNATLSAMGTPTITAGSGTKSLTIAKSGLYAYSANLWDASISQLSIDSSGALTALIPPKVAAGSGPNSVGLHPNGTRAYVTNIWDNTVSTYAVNSDGTLSASGFTAIATGSNPQSIAIDPQEAFAWVANAASNTVSVFLITSAGTLTNYPTPITVATGLSPMCIVAHPNGKYAYVVNRDSNTVSQYSFERYGARYNGVLSPLPFPTVAAGSAPVFMTIDPSGLYAYVVNKDSNSISQYTINSNGNLTPMSPATVATGSGPVSIATRQ